jgi:hypothetical protein
MVCSEAAHGRKRPSLLQSERVGAESAPQAGPCGVVVCAFSAAGFRQARGLAGGCGAGRCASRGGTLGVSMTQGYKY